MSDKIKSSVLYGAIIGDISGSPYERNPIKTKDYKFIRHRGHFTDDTVMTIAVADALLSCQGFNESDVKKSVTEAMQRWGRKYPHAGYGHGFKGWLKAANPHPYKSFGNGAAMRVSAVALLAYISNNFDLVRDVARWTAEVTHNNPEAVKSVEAVASAINLAQHGVSKDEIKSYLESEFGYDLSRTLDEIRPTYEFEVAAEKSVPEAIIAFLESTDFEDAIRNAVSLGGDADTQAAIAGSIAEAFYGVPEEFKIKAREKLPRDMRVVLDEINKIVRQSQAYKNLVERAKNQYPEYNPKVKPSDADKQRTRDFAEKFDDKQKFWDALKAKGLTWTQTSNDNTTDMWARNALSKAIACGFDPNAEVNLFAPTVDGVNVCDEINLYTYWQGFGYAKKTPKIKYLLVAQDWGNFFAAPDEFKSTVAKMNAGENIFYPFSLESPTDKNLIELFKILGRDVTKPCKDVFFTNFCLGYRLGNNSGGMTKKLMMRDAELFRELCEILQPENILCLGRITSECVWEALTGEKFKEIYGDAKSYNDFLDNEPEIVAPCSSDKKTLSRVYPLAHCGGMGTAMRPLDKQRADWQWIFYEQQLDEAIENFCRTNSPEDEQRVLDEIFSRLQLNDRFVVALHEPPMDFDYAMPIFQNMKSVFMRNKHDGKHCLAAFTNLSNFARFNEASGRIYSFMYVPARKLFVDCMNGGGIGDEIILNLRDENQFRLTQDLIEDLLNR